MDLENSTPRLQNLNISTMINQHNEDNNYHKIKMKSGKLFV